MKCPRCQFENPPDSKFCKECGTKLIPSEEIPVSLTKTLKTPMEELTTGSTYARRYQIIEELGRGGMGVVYKAEDTKLKRTVALKFLSPEFTRDSETKERFIQEAQAAAALDHPNICTVHEIDEAEGKTFISMAYVEGQSLREKVGSWPMKLDELVEISIQVAEGLDEAHKKGVVHRDIKSSNIMVSEKGQAKIMDFGLAKVTGRTMVTKERTIMGTITYMSPEQVRGEKVDYRTDIWSLGVVLYEMITGELPFKAEYEQGVLYSIVNETHTHVTDIRAGVPFDLERIVDKALEKEKEDRYQHVDEMLTDLRKVRTELKGEIKVKKAVEKPKWYASPALWILTVVVIGLFAGILTFLPQKTLSFEERDWILIADFENTTGNDVFSGALEEALTRELSQSKYVNVVPPERKQDTLHLMKKNLDTKIDESVAREIALRDGGIRAVVSGNLRQIGETFVLTINIMDPQSGAIAESFVEETRGIDKILDAIRRLANRMREKLGESLTEIAPLESSVSGEWIEKVTTPHLKALKLYRRGFAYINQFKWDKALLFLQQAIEQDPSFAMAYCAAGFMYFNMGRFAEAENYFDRALALSENVADREKYFIRGGYGLITGDYEKAIEQYSILIDLYPDDFWGHTNLFDAYGFIGDYKKTYEHLLEMVRVRPNSPGPISIAIWFELGHFGNLEKARSYYNQIEKLAPDFDHIPYQTFKPLDCWLSDDLEGAERELHAALERTRGLSNLTQIAVRQIFASFFIYKGQFQQALEWTRDIGDLAREGGEKTWEGSAFWQIGMIEREWGKISNFKRQMQFLLNNYPDPVSTGASGWLAFHEALMGRSAEANRFLEKASESKMNKVEKKAFVFLLKGALALGEKHHEKAIENFKRAIQIFPHMNLFAPPYFYQPIIAYKSLAEAYTQNGQLNLAIETLQEIVNQKSQSFFPGFAAGPFNWVKAHYHLGQIYQQKGNKELAIEYYNKFLNLWKNGDPEIAELINAKKQQAALKSQ